MIHSNLLIRLIAFLLILFCFSSLLHAAPNHSKTTLFYLYNDWKTEFLVNEDNTKQGVFGISARHYVSPDLVFQLLSTLSSMSLSNNFIGFDESLSAFNDVRLQGTYYLRNKLVSVKIVTNLPTGKKKLTAKQYLIATSIADKSRHYSIRRLGQGFDIGGSVYLHPKTESANFTLGIGYLTKGEYQILDRLEAKYKHGNEINLTAGVETKKQPISFIADITFKIFGKDEFDAIPIFQSGNLIGLRGRIKYAKQISGSIGFSLYSRGAAKVTNGSSGELSEETTKSGRNELHLFANGAIPLTEKIHFLGQGQFSNIGANEYEIADQLFRPKSTYFGFGAGVATFISKVTSASIQMTYYTGKFNEDFNLSGFGINGTLTFRYW